MAPVIDVKCFQCGKTIKVKSEFAGKKGKCPVCSKVIIIPDPQKPADTLLVNEDISSADVKRVAATIANGPGRREVKKKGIFAKLFGKK